MKIRQFFLNFVIQFHHFASKSPRNKAFVFTVLLISWALAIFSFTKIDLSTSSADLLPDSSVTLQKMAKGMDLAPFSRLFFVDIYEESGNAEILEKSAKIIEENVPKHLALPLHEQANIKPEDLMQFLPNFFTAKAEAKAYENIERQKASASIENVIHNISTFAPASLISWLLVDPFNFKDSILQALPSSISQNTQSFSINSYTYSPDKKHILLTFQPIVSIHDTKAATELIESIRQSAKELPDSIQLNFNGGIVHTAVNTQVIENDIKNIVFYSFIALILLYIFLVRSFSGIWLLLTPALAISLSLGIISSFSAIISGLALGFGSAVLGIAEDYAVHIHCALEKEKNIDKILSLLTIPLFQGFLLNISGFTVLTFSSLPAIRQLALFALLSLCFGLLIALFILPLCPRFKTFSFLKKIEIKNREKNTQEEFQTPVLSRCLILCAALCILCFYLFTHTKVDVSPRSMGVSLNFADTDNTKFAQTWLTANNSQSLENASLFILEAENEEELFINSRILSGKLNLLLEKQAISSSNKEISKIDTIAYFFPTKKEQEENIQRFKNFVSTNKTYLHSLIEENTKMFNMPSRLFTPFFNILEKENSLITIENIANSSLSNLVDFFLLETAELGKNKYYTLFVSKQKISFENEYTDLADFAKLIELSPQALENEILTSFYEEATYLPIALILCSLILYLCYFDIAKTLLALTPALFSLFSVLLGLFLLQSPLTLGALTALLLVLGLALDHGILVSCDLEHGIELNLKRAVLISSLSTIASIGLLAFASHPTLRDMGRIILLGLLLEVPVSLYLLPFLCKKKQRKEEICN